MPSIHQPLYGGSGDVGILLCHGFTGSPYSMRPWAEDLLDAGHRISLPRLPGHGTSWQELLKASWTDWYECVEREYLALRRDCRTVLVAGLSMGGALALRVSQNHPDVDGVVLVNPAVSSYNRMVPWAKYVAPFMQTVGSISSDIAKPGMSEKGYDRTPVAAVAATHELWKTVRADLGQVTAPMLIFRSATDHVVPAESTKFIARNVSSPLVVQRVLHRSYHVATLDWDAPTIFAETRDFVSVVADPHRLEEATP